MSNGDEKLAEKLEFALVRRPDRLTKLMLEGMPAEARAEQVATSEAIAALGVTAEPITPSGALKDRIFATLRERAKNAPKRAVVVCDMINDHLVPGRVLEVPRARAIVPALAARLTSARASGVPVVYVLDRHAADDPELDVWGSHAIEGTDGAEVWPALAPKPGDKVVTKPSYSGFHGTDLEAVLDSLAVDTIVLTGCATEVQLMATATDALQLGFAVEMPPDSQAGAAEPAEQVTMAVLAALVPYAPARIKRLERARATANS
jgi:nicotinamidase-related amidase